MAMRIDPTPFKGGEDPLPLYREDQSAADFPIHTLGELRSVVEATAEIIQAPIAAPPFEFRWELEQDLRDQNPREGRHGYVP